MTHFERVAGAGGEADHDLAHGGARRFGRPVLTRDGILAASRTAGWILAVGLLIAVVAAVLALTHLMQYKRALGVATKNAFIQRVIACRHEPSRAKRTWQECERIVQRGE